MGIDQPSVVSVRKDGKEHWLEAPIRKFKYGDSIVKLYRHPMKLVPKSVFAWEKDYRYSGDLYAMVPFLDRHPCALELKEVYEGAVAMFKAQK